MSKTTRDLLTLAAELRAQGRHQAAAHVLSLIS